jgi:hypothetical protein
MKCELCHRNSADERLCRVCAEAVQRVLQITIEGKHTQVNSEPGKASGKAVGAGH